MKDRFELLSIFRSFFNEIKNQFGKIVKILISNNAKEYFSTTFFHSYLPREFCISQPVLTLHNKMV